MTRARVLYVTSRFPKLTETFVINEWLALAPRFDMELAALVRTKEQCVHAQASAVLDRVWFPGLVSVDTLRANVRVLVRSPRTYLRVLAQLLRATPRRPVEVAKATNVFVKSVALAERARREGVDHVHAHFANHPATAAWIVHRLAALPFSFTAHANDMFLSPPLLRQKVDEAAFVVTISEYNAGILRRMTPRSPIHVVHCGVDTTTLARIVRPRRGRRVLCVASLEPRKGHRHLLKAFAELAAHDADLHLTLVGDGPERDAIVGRARALGISGRVELTGPLSAGDVRRELAAADVFVLASVADRTGRTEGIPVALMEAMAAGVPVVTTRISGIPELVEGVGRLVEPGDADELASAISSVLDDSRIDEAVGLARARVAEQFDLFGEATKLGDLFEASFAVSTRAGSRSQPRPTAEDGAGDTPPDEVRHLGVVSGTESEFVRLGTPQEVEGVQPRGSRAE
jgi:colanic acid/amylovoran biosynthesis glycosyltransferase